MTWYAVHTKPKAEIAVDHQLWMRGYETLCLLERRPWKHARKETTVLRAHYPRYLFAGLSEDQGHSVAEINRVPGVSTVVYDASGALEVPGEVIEELRGLADHVGDERGGQWIVPDEKARPKEWLYAGQRVRIASGPFGGLYATVRETAPLDGATKILLWLEALGSRTKLQAPADGVEVVSPRVRFNV